MQPLTPPPAEYDRNMKTHELIYAARKLYPHVEHNIPLPRKWDSAQASSYLELSPNALTVTFKHNANVANDKDPSGVVRSDCSIPLSVGPYYFEVRILQGQSGSMGIGLSLHGGDLNRMPGWDAQCYGYHGDDGNFFSACGHGKAYGPRFESGDVIGCGVDTFLNEVFFTKNGKHLGVAYTGQLGKFEKMYPTVGLKTAGERLHVNFGLNKFMFDFEGYRTSLMYKKIHHIQDTPMCENIGKFMDRVVLSFLGQSGALESLEAFEKVAKQQDKTIDHGFLRKRKEIVDMVMSGKHGSRIQEKIEENFPNALTDKYREQLLLMCLRYVDLANTMQRAPPSFRSTNEPGRPASPTEIRSRPQKLLKGAHCKSTKRTREAQKKQGKSRTPPPVRRTNAKAAEDLCLKSSNIDKFFTDEDTGEEMLRIDGISITKKMYVELYNSDEFAKLAYMIKMGREINTLASKCAGKLTPKDREIIEKSISMVLSPSHLEKHPISYEYRRYIANVLMQMINDFVYPPVPPFIDVDTRLSPLPPTQDHRIYSELRGMFLGWQGIHQELATKDSHLAAINFMRTLTLEPLVFNEPVIEFSLEPRMEESDDSDAKPDEDEEPGPADAVVMEEDREEDYPQQDV